ncbi:transglutaminase family protein [uncultured Tateyamaria sp.]|uniref:transglutaminase family protein n=1 Tax=Tateyamaria sp. 1078 TaxID=3417464 RepID=UPI0026195BB8|nr:transglutaminase family protein [uncultured Tateyamaria sp.]
MRLNIRHVTTYSFEDPVAYGLQQLRKTPKSTWGQTVTEWQTDVAGGAKEVSFEDHHNNVVELISFERQATKVVVTSTGVVEIDDTAGVMGKHKGPSPLWLYLRSTPLTHVGPGVRALVRTAREADSDLDKLHKLMAAIRDVVAYEVGSSYPDWTAEQAIEEGRGVCQDHTHIFAAAARELGFPARYVSGYLMLDDRLAQDAMHAWAEAHVDGLGWVGFDVSNSISPDTRYVRVATGLDYHEAAPVTGTRIGGADETLRVDIEVAQQ